MKKKPFLLNGRHIQQEEKLVIGIMGTHQGAGVTHTGIVLASHESQILGKKTAYLELNGEDFYYLQKACYDKILNCEDKMVFSIDGITFYRKVEAVQIAEILNEDYECIILDFGVSFTRWRSEFLRCSQKIVVCSLSDWKRENLFQFLETSKKENGYRQWIYLTVSGPKEAAILVRKKWKISISFMHFTPDPFVLSKETIRFLYSLL